MITIKRHDILLKKRGLLATGLHVVMIESIQETLAPEKIKAPWDDVTPQLAIRFKNKEGFVTMWLNTVGYMTKSDYIDTPSDVTFKMHPFSKVWYAVGPDNKRVINPDKTKVCNAMLQRLAYCCGFKMGSSIDIMDIIGREVGIRVQELNNFPKVTDFFLLKTK